MLPIEVFNSLQEVQSEWSGALLREDVKRELISLGISIENKRIRINRLLRVLNNGSINEERSSELRSGVQHLEKEIKKQKKRIEELQNDITSLSSEHEWRLVAVKRRGD